MNQGWLNWPVSAVPVLPATSTPLRAAAVPVPSRTTFFIMSPSWPAAFGEITRDWRVGSTRLVTRPSLATTRSTRVGRISLPPLPTAEATIAICSGVARIWPSRPPWPMATRPTSKAWLAGHHAALGHHAGGDHLLVRVVERRVLAEAEAVHVA